MSKGNTVSTVSDNWVEVYMNLKEIREDSYLINDIDEGVDTEELIVGLANSVGGYIYACCNGRAMTPIEYEKLVDLVSQYRSAHIHHEFLSNYDLTRFNQQGVVLKVAKSPRLEYTQSNGQTPVILDNSGLRPLTNVEENSILRHVDHSGLDVIEFIKSNSMMGKQFPILILGACISWAVSEMMKLFF